MLNIKATPSDNPPLLQRLIFSLLALLNHDPLQDFHILTRVSSFTAHQSEARSDSAKTHKNIDRTINADLLHS